jgi:hypothetical protein
MDNTGMLFYHGSATKLETGQNLNPTDNWNFAKTERLNAVFSTTDFARAQIFGLRKCFFDKGLLIWHVDPAKTEEKKAPVNSLYLQKMRPPRDIIENYYVYEVAGDNMRCDSNNEYFSCAPVSIKSIKEYDLWNVLFENNFGIRLLEESFDKECHDLPALRRYEIAETEYIPNGRWKSVKTDDLFLRKKLANGFSEEELDELIALKDAQGIKKLLALFADKYNAGK